MSNEQVLLTVVGAIIGSTLGIGAGLLIVSYLQLKELKND